jgi:hypothetical protein
VIAKIESSCGGQSDTRIGQNAGVNYVLDAHVLQVAMKVRSQEATRTSLHEAEITGTSVKFGYHGKRRTAVMCPRRAEVSPERRQCIPVVGTEAPNSQKRDGNICLVRGIDDAAARRDHGLARPVHVVRRSQSARNRSSWKLPSDHIDDNDRRTRGVKRGTIVRANRLQQLESVITPPGHLASSPDMRSLRPRRPLVDTRGLSPAPYPNPAHRTVPM